MGARAGAEGVTRRVDVVASVLTVGLLLLAYLPGLTTATLLPDELVYLEAGAALVAGDGSVNPEHPPLAKLLFGLAQTVVPDPVLAVRLVGVAAGLAIAAALYLLVRRAADHRWALGAVAAWAILPHALRSPDGAFGGFDKLDRYGMLDPVATALAMLALVAAARWLDDRRARWLVAAGALLGLAGAAKLSALLLLPVLVLLPALVPAWRPRVIWAAWATLGAAVVAGFVVAFVPLGGEAPAALVRVFSLQAEHRTAGHPVVIGGVLHHRAPWWASLAYQWRDDGPLLTAALTVAAVIGVASRRSGADLRVLLAAAVVIPAAGVAAGSVTLPHYRFLWLPPLVALGVLGVRALSAQGRAGRATAVVLAAVVLAVGTQTLLHTATRDVSGYRLLAETLDDLDRPVDTALVHGYVRLVGHYAPDVALVSGLPADVVILDPRVTARRPVPELERELEERGDYHRTEVERFEVWIRRPRVAD